MSKIKKSHRANHASKLESEGSLIFNFLKRKSEDCTDADKSKKRIIKKVMRDDIRLKRR